MIHPTSDVQTTKIGENTVIWQYCVVLPDAVLGSNCNINCNVFIENDVVIGDNVTIKTGVQIWNGVTLENDVFVGPNVTFTNDLFPRSKKKLLPLLRTVVKEGASIGGNATILAGRTIGRYAMVGAGAVVTKNIADFELWVGNPAKHVGYVTEKGEVLNLDLISKRTGKQYHWKDDLLIEKFDHIITAEDIKMRLIEKSDAKFVVELRTDPKLGQNLSWTSSKVEDEINWIEEYKKREADKKEFYFIFEDKNHNPWGTIRLYNFKENSFTIGSWICLPKNNEKIAVKAWLLSVAFGFEKLNFNMCMFDVRKKNLSVLYYAYLYHPELISEDKLNYYFRLDKDTFYENRQKVIDILKIKL